MTDQLLSEVRAEFIRRGPEGWWKNGFGLLRGRMCLRDVLVAVATVRREPWEPAHQVLVDLIGDTRDLSEVFGVTNFNDREETTWDDVVALLDKATMTEAIAA